MPYRAFTINAPQQASPRRELFKGASIQMQMVIVFWGYFCWKHHINPPKKNNPNTWPLKLQSHPSLVLYTHLLEQLTWWFYSKVLDCHIKCCNISLFALYPKSPGLVGIPVLSLIDSPSCFQMEECRQLSSEVDLFSLYCASLHFPASLSNHLQYYA